MDDLRKAAEMALEALHNIDQSNNDDAIEALRQALNETPPCKTDPDAPHGFDRNASHNADRYVCECEGWEPVDAVNMSQECVDETAKGEHEPVAWITDGGKGDLGWRKTTEKDIPLYTAPPKKEWVGLTDEEIHEVVSKKWWDWEDAFDIEGFSRAIEAKLKEKNSG